MDFLTLAKDRYSARKFVSGEVPQEDIDKIIEAGLCAPTAVNYQPFKIWAFESAEAKAKLLSCTKISRSKFGRLKAQKQRQNCFPAQR